MSKKDTGIVPIHGKEYKTVALRISEFREKHPDFTIHTELVEANEKLVIMKATISAANMVISTGYAEEVRTSSKINSTSALENAETSAVGRALAFFGLAGSEIASADEVVNAIERQKSGEANVVAVMNELLEYDERLAILYFMRQEEEAQIEIHNSAPKNEKTAFKARIKALEKSIHDWADEASTQVVHCLQNEDEAGVFEIVDEMHSKEKRFFWARLTPQERQQVTDLLETREQENHDDTSH